MDTFPNVHCLMSFLCSISEANKFVLSDLLLEVRSDKVKFILLGRDGMLALPPVHIFGKSSETDWWVSDWMVRWAGSYPFVWVLRDGWVKWLSQKILPRHIALWVSLQRKRHGVNLKFRSHFLFICLKSSNLGKPYHKKKRKSSDNVTRGPPPLHQLVTAWGCGPDPP